MVDDKDKLADVEQGVGIDSTKLVEYVVYKVEASKRQIFTLIKGSIAF